MMLKNSYDSQNKRLGVIYAFIIIYFNQNNYTFSVYAQI